MAYSLNGVVLPAGRAEVYTSYALYLLLATAPVVTAVDARAANLTWDGSDSNDWLVGANWDTGAAPTNGDRAVIKSNIPLSGVLLDSGAANAGTVFLGNTSGADFSITANGALTTGSFIVGNSTNNAGDPDIALESGTVTVSGASATWTTDFVDVGYYGTGTINVTDGANLNVNSTGSIGSQAGSEGLVKLSGAGTNLSSSGTSFSVGSTGKGTLKLSDGATADFEDLAVAIAKDARGIVELDGKDTRLTVNSSTFSVGQKGHASVSVTGGAKLSANAVRLARNDPAAKADLTVSGAGSAFTANGFFNVGNEGTASIVVSNGGLVSGNPVLLGYEQTADGSLLVEGADSMLDADTYLMLGYHGTGEATVRNDGAIKVAGSSGILIGNKSDGVGTLNIGAAAGDAARAAGTIDVASIDMGDGDADLVFNHTETGYDFTPEIDGAGDITHVNGTTRLTGDSSGFTGTTTVSGGKLAVVGQLGGDVNVGAGGTLGGGGRVGGLEVAGALAPGSSVGTLDVDGDVTFKSGATYEVEVDAGGADRVSAGGTAALDGDVAVTSLAPDEDTSVLGDYTIVSATGGVTGTFNGVTANYAFLEPSLSYTADSAVLTLGYDGEPSNLLSGVAKGRNARRVVDTLDSVDKSDPGYTAFENALLTLKNGQEEAAARELSGETLPTVDTNVAKTNSAFLSSIQGRISGGGGGSLASGAGIADAARGIQLAARGRETTHVTPQPALPALPDASGRSWLDGPSAWARVVGRESTLDASGGLVGATQRSSGMHGGVEMPVGAGVGDGLMLGGALGFEHGDLESGRSTDSDFKAYSMGLYFRQTLGDFRLSGSGSHTRTTLDSRRRVTGFGIQRADYEARIWALDTELAYDIDVAEGIDISPLAGLRYSYTERDGYQEQGAAGLTVPQSTAHALRGRLGAEAAYYMAPITFSLRAAWSHGIKQPDATTDASLLGGDTFTIDGQNLPQDIAEVGLGADVVVDDGVEVFAAYDGQFSGRYRSHNGQIGVRIAF